MDHKADTVEEVGIQEPDQSDRKVNRPLKRRKRCLIPDNMSVEERNSKIKEFHGELQSLFHYFKEMLCEKEHLKGVEVLSCSGDSSVAYLLEERDLPFSKLVQEIYEKLKDRGGISLDYVRSLVHLVGERKPYGIGNADGKSLEDDDTESCLWCWETKDLKLFQQTHRGLLHIRRICRSKIQERITAVSGMISALEISLTHSNQNIDLTMPLENLVKALDEADIRLWVEKMIVLNNETEMDEKKVKLKDKEVMKALERERREDEKEKRRSEKDKLQREKKQKRLQEEAEKEAKRQEKEEVQKKKQLKRQQEEAEKDQRRREKKAADFRKQLALRKQAKMMEQYFKIKKSESSTKVYPSSAKILTLASSVKRDDTPTALTLPMDHALSLKNALETSDLCRSQFDDWIRLGRSTHAHRSRHWGMRRKPKTILVKELKLKGSSSKAGDSAKVLSSYKGSGCHVELSIEKLVDGLEETVPDDKSCQNNGDCSQTGLWLCSRTKKLLQFDKSHGLAYYGTLSKKSDIIGPRHPFMKDPDLEYDIESDEEWDEEEPGESLSDSDKDEEEENLDEGNLRDEDEVGSLDRFLVSDAENEGVQDDNMEVDSIDGEEFRALLRQQKHINNLTERALEKDQPLIISNLMHEKTTLLMAEDLSGIPKVEQTFLQALSIRPFPGGRPSQISAENNTEDEVQDILPIKK